MNDPKQLLAEFEAYMKAKALQAVERDIKAFGEAVAQYKKDERAQEVLENTGPGIQTTQRKRRHRRPPNVMYKGVDDERWLPIPGYNGVYEVNAKGSVRSWQPRGRWHGGVKPARPSQPVLLRTIGHSNTYLLLNAHHAREYISRKALLALHWDRWNTSGLA